MPRTRLTVLGVPGRARRRAAIQVENVAGSPFEALTTVNVVRTSPFEALIETSGALAQLFEVLVTAQRQPDSPFEALGEVVAAPGAPFELLAEAIDDLGTSFEALGEAVNAQGSPVEALGPVSQAPDSPFEALEQVAGAPRSPFEVLDLAEEADRLPFEVLQAVTKQPGSPLEALGEATNAPGSPFEALGLVEEAPGSPLEFLQTIAQESESSFEALVTADQETGSPLEALGEATNAPGSPLEALGLVEEAPRSPFEFLQAIAQESGSPFEALVTADQETGSPFEALVGITSITGPPVEAIDVIDEETGQPFEFLQAIAGQQGKPFEALGTATSQQGSPSEALGGVIRQAGSPQEAASLIDQAPANPIEVLVTAVTVNGTPLEHLITVIADVGKSRKVVEFLGLVQSLLEVPFEALITAAEDTGQPTEALGEASVIAGTPTEALGIVEGIEFSAIEFLISAETDAGTQIEARGFVDGTTATPFENLLVAVQKAVQIAFESRGSIKSVQVHLFEALRALEADKEGAFETVDAFQLGLITPFRFRTLAAVPIALLDIDAVGIQWELEPTIEPEDSFEFFVDRSGSPDGPWEDVVGELVGNLFIDKTVNRLSEQREIWYRIRVRNKLTGETFASTDPAAFPRRTDWTDDLPRHGISFFENLEAGALSLHTTLDLRQLEMIRRHNLVLLRFSGTPIAIRKARSFGQPCPDCFDELLGRNVTSNCPSCFGVGFLGGYFDQINTFAHFDPNPKQVRIGVRGEQEVSITTAWMSNFPIMSNRDLIVEPDGRRWLVTRVDFTGLRLQHSRQLLQLREINPNEKNYYDVPIEPIEFDDPSEFIGFGPKGGSGLL